MCARGAGFGLVLLLSLSLAGAGCGFDESGVPGDGGGAESAAEPVCGNGILEDGEECDDGNADDQDGCRSDCTFTCVTGDPYRDCDDHNPCNGGESCSADHVCLAGTPPVAGSPCGDHLVCVNGNCVAPSCGDGQLQDGEECDDGNSVAGDGCEPGTCTYTCVAADPTRDCSGDECAGVSTCNGATHTCTAGTPLDDGTPCDGGAGYCHGGVCTTAVCGNQIVEPGEQCDDGNTDDTDGCRSDCTYTCTGAAACDDGNPCTQDLCDPGPHTCSNPADTTQDGHACTAGATAGTCQNGVCVPAGCGNGNRDSGEQCDNGAAGNGPGTGCTVSCQFECQADADCSDGNACNGSETCAVVAGGQTCQAGTPLAQGDVCLASPRSICNAAGACVPSVCGDLYVDVGAGEECDDGNTNDLDGCTQACTYTCTSGADCDDANPCTQNLCDTNAHTCSHPADSAQEGQPCTAGAVTGACHDGACVPAACGDGHLDQGEECDNGPGGNGPGTGCTASCQFECDGDPDCGDGNACNGLETCVTVTGGKRCEPGTPLATGAVCQTSPRAICNAAGSCVLSICGDLIVDPGAGEECDDANTDNRDGCTDQCQYTCTSGTQCGDGNACTQDLCDPNTHTCSNPADQAQNGQPCSAGGTAGTCQNGACVPAACGNGIVDSGEQCDNGPGGNGPGTGCSSSCQYECQGDADCSDGNACNGSETCVTVAGGQRCQAGAPLGTGAVCQASPRHICNAAGSCVLSTCGDGYVDAGAGEVCDKGAQNGPGSGCTTSCQYECTSDAGCSDGNLCDGTETCVDVTGGKTCHAGTDAVRGTVCGSAPRSICNGGGACVTSVCGDGYLDAGAGEECDNGPGGNGPGTGCTTLCQLECHGDADCSDGNACTGTETCMSVTGGQTCHAGTPLATGAVCQTSPRRICGASSQCVLSTCGDGYVDAGAGEVCDKGVQNGPGSGCTTSCQYECTSDAGCGDGNLCNGTETCVDVTGGKTCQPGTNATRGTVCNTAPRSICNGSGACVSSVCGDGYVDAGAGEECDNGPGGNGPGTGCTTLCRFECHGDADCSDSNPCNGTEICTSVAGGQTCHAGTPLATGAVCQTSPRRICNASSQCVLSSCGDSYVDSGAGEQCDPPNGTTCDSSCRTITCGDGVIAGSEQCDDHNTFNLDGCNSGCGYEVVTRMTSVVIQGTAAPSWCTPTTNRLGTQSFTPTALGQLNPSLQSGIDDGSTTILTELIGLDDLTGVSDPNGLTIGVMSGLPDPARGAWPGPPSPIDWWFLVDHTTVNGAGLPTGVLANGALAARRLTAGPSDVNLVLLLGGTPANLRLRSTRIAATINGTPTPNVPAPPPNQLASGLTVFQTMTASGTGQGLCGDATVESLAQIPLPQALAQGGGTACGNCSGSKQYTYCGANQPVGPTCNSLLDAIVGGCKVMFCLMTVINPQQPDVAGSDGDIDTLTLGTGNKVPQSQVTGNDDAYSMYLKFDANRVHITGESCTATPDCQTGKTCVAGVCQ